MSILHIPMGQKRRQELAIEELTGKVRKLQGMIDDILSVQQTSTTYSGNDYTSYELQVEAADEKYRGVAAWGNIQVGAIVAIRATFIISEGIKIIKNVEDADREVEFLNKLFSDNGLDRETPQYFATEAELEGKILLKLFPMFKETEDLSSIKVRFVPWTGRKYEVETDPNDYLDYKRVKWDLDGKRESIDAPQFVYKKFGGRVSDPNDAQSRVLRVLTQIENVDKALRDWREINKVYAAPIPDMKLETEDQVERAREEFEEYKNFIVKKIFFHVGEFSFKAPDMAGVRSLADEIITNAKIISGATGVPVHFLGFPDLLSNRATADNLMELVSGSTLSERIIWIGAYNELKDKAFDLWNERFAANMSSAKMLDKSKVSIDIPFVRESVWDHLRDVIFPALATGDLSRDYFLSQIPGLDIEEEKARLEEKEASDFETMKTELDRLREEKLTSNQQTSNQQTTDEEDSKK